MKIIAKSVLVNQDGNVLLLARSSTDAMRAGDWDFPGGGIETGEGILDGACREIVEEAGIVVSPSQLQLIFAGTKYSEAHQESQSRLLFVARVETSAVTLSNEHSAFSWVAPQKALALWNHPFWTTGLQYALTHQLLP